MSETVPVPVPPPIVPVPVPFALPPSPYSDVATFRSHYPEFSDTTVYPDGRVQMFLDTGSVMFNPAKWGYYLPMAVELFTAHMLALGQYAAVRAAGGGAMAVPGLSSGLMTNKSVSKVSVGYDVTTTAIEGAGPWNYTIYGQQLMWFMSWIGAGGFETLALTMPGLAGHVTEWATGVMGLWTH